MTVPCIITVGPEVTADADGDIEITVAGGCYGEDVDRTFTASEMRAIVERAEAHHGAYTIFKESDYEDEDAYYASMKRFE